VSVAYSRKRDADVSFRVRSCKAPTMRNYLCQRQGGTAGSLSERGPGAAHDATGTGPPSCRDQTPMIAVGDEKPPFAYGSAPENACRGMGDATLPATSHPPQHADARSRKCSSARNLNAWQAFSRVAEDSPRASSRQRRQNRSRSVLREVDNPRRPGLASAEKAPE